MNSSLGETKKMAQTQTQTLRLENLFSDQDLEYLEQYLSDPRVTSQIDQHLGRKRLEGVVLPLHTQQRLTDLVNQHAGVDNLIMNMPPQFVEYSSEYGEPNLNPHYDGDFNEFIIDYQFQSNTSWPLGVDLEIHELEDNSAILFRPNGLAHWRPRKTFQPGEYVRMFFFRFFDPNNPADNSHLPNHPQDKAFSEVNAFRDSLD